MLRKFIFAVRSKKNQSKPTHGKSSDQIHKQRFDKSPQQFRKIYNYQKQAGRMEVASEAQLNNQAIATIVNEQRQKLKELQHHSYSELQKFIYSLNGASLLGTAVSAGLFGLKGLGLWSACGLFPSILVTGTCIVGYNIGGLICRQGLNLFVEDQQLKEVTLTQSPKRYYIEMGLCVGQLYLMSLASTNVVWMGIPPNYIWLGSAVGLLSLIGHSYYQQSQLNQMKWTGLPTITSLFSLMCGIYLLLLINLGENEEFRKGVQRSKTMLRKDRLSGDQTTEKINTVINIQD